MKIEHLPEQQLVFAGNSHHIDPKLGLMLYGPSNWKDTEEQPGEMIKAGVIGTAETMHLFREFLERMRMRIAPSKRTMWTRDFPGLGVRAAFHFDISIEKDAEEEISKGEEESILNHDKREDRIEWACRVYEDRFDSLVATAHPKPDIIYVLISRRMMDATKDPKFGVDKILAVRRSMRKDATFADYPMFNFHHFVKVLGFKHSIVSQMVRPSTLERGASLQDEATIAWNFAVASYYKATGTPWKLATLDEETCYVGVSFYQELGKEGSNMRASMAHVYLKSGESQIIRSRPFEWKGPKGRSPHLTNEQAAEILKDVVNLFEKQQGKKPGRILVHKSSEFTDAEVKGFCSVASDASVDLVHIHRGKGVRLYIDGNPYPPLRGTLLTNGEDAPAILYTVGFVPGLGTYVGHGVPEPITFSWGRRESSVRSLAEDILALTKLDWNNSDFCTRLPVTISVSDKVGDILSESAARTTDPPDMYSYFM